MDENGTIIPDGRTTEPTESPALPREHEVLYEYEYDSYGNWTRQTENHSYVPTNRPTSTSAIASLRTTDFVAHSVSLRKFTQGDSMTEERKPAILFAATILAARKLQPMQKQK